jgi:glycosyltransferase involved in cell wall biosynthesis
MQIGIDCLKIEPSFAGGLNTYTLGLLGGFAAAGNGHRFHVYVTRANQHLFAKQGSQRNLELTVVDKRSLPLRNTLCRAMLLSRSPKLYEQVSNAAFRNIRAMMNADCDIIYTPTVVLQSFNSSRPTVLSMHDIQHVHYPEFFSWPRRLSRKITYDLSARNANYFQASSNFIKQDMLAHFPGISPEQIEVIPEGVNLQDFSKRRDTSALQLRYGLPRKFLFYPAQLWPHKNHLTVLQALKQIEMQEGLKIPLVLTGARYAAAPAIRKFVASQAMDYVRYLGKVPFEDLVGLYQMAGFVISASLYEASSLPVLEAAAAGTAIIASRIPSNEELAPKLHLNWFHPLRADELAGLIFTLWKDEQTAAAQAAHNRDHIAAYSWENAARQYVKLFERIVNR